MATKTPKKPSQRVSQETHLYAKWDKKEQDILYFGPKVNGGMLAMFFEVIRPPLTILQKPSEKNMTLMEELEDRGYDLTTLKFSIKRKWPLNGTPPEGWDKNFKKLGKK